VKVLIAGAGLAGAYLARRLVVEGICKQKDITIYDPMDFGTKCGIAPCGFGINARWLEKAVELAQLPRDYAFETFEKIYIGKHSIKTTVATFNKPLFIKDCLRGFKVVKQRVTDVPGGYDVTIDATGKRYVIGQINDPEHEFIGYCVQKRVKKTREYDAIRADRLDDGVGYYWEFPMGNTVHVGAGTINGFPDIVKMDGICSCRGTMRLSGPSYSKPLFRECGSGTVVAIGESAGCVSSLTGAGNREAIECVEILIKNWGNWEEYQRRVLRNFKWCDREFEVLKKIASGRKPSLLDYITVVLERKGTRVGLQEAKELVKYIFRI